MKLTTAQKQNIAAAYVGGTSLADICRTYEISESGFYRLRRSDQVYKAAEACFQDELNTHLCLLLDQHAKGAIQTLKGILALDIQNFVESEGPNGGKTVARRIDPKLVSERRLAADAILSHWQRLSEHQQAQHNWESEHTYIPDDDENEDIEKE